MIELERTGVGTADVTAGNPISNIGGLLPVQAAVTGTATYRLLGRIAEDAPWVEIRAADTADFIESFSWVAFMRLEITVGAGSVKVWIGE